MNKLFGGRKPSASLVISIGALILALAGTSLALPGRNSVDSGDIKAGAVKRGDHAKNQQTLWANVDADGDIVAQSGGVSVIEDAGAGGYHMRFPENLGKRPITATVRAGGGNNGMASVVRCGTSPAGGAGCTFGNNQRHIYVNTRETTGAGNDEPFIVTVLPR